MTGEPQAAELGGFLKARRMELRPEDVGLPSTGRRRVKGLRREEVALLTAISTDYYTRIEQGRRHPPEATLDAIARVLRLNADEREYAFELVRATAVGTGRARHPRSADSQIPAGVQALMDAMVSAPAVVQNGRLDLLGSNALGHALYADAFRSRSRRPNLGRFVFLDPRARDFYPDWGTMADYAVSILRAEAGHSPYNKDLTDLVGELATRSEEFKTRWAAHHVRAHRSGVKRLRHPVVGELTLRYEGLEIPNSGGLILFGYIAEPGSASEDALKLLGELDGERPRQQGCDTRNDAAQERVAPHRSF